ncbi:mercuric reductase [Dyella caseinilytica]|uniref:Mercuric reductase n=1 Tax=Dyella caseinilytica TaxID=1849581 RepID=A0ABX7GYH8_9GAMM|nr:mercuric reductase [Dyella caseinilytica]QRN55552.1 mercuric reductase [Dyella caseinilytica]GGA02604.1 mercuric reductase [Dyella caseinilytica]
MSLSFITPEDAYERERIANVRPHTWNNPPPTTPYQLVIIGAGPAGVAAAEVANALGARVALIERDMIGGDCLTNGCIPSKTMIRTAQLYAEMRDARRYGAEMPSDITVDFPAVMERVRRIRTHLSGGVSAQRLAQEGIDLFFGDARFTGPDALMIKGEILRFEKALIATGAHPLIPPIPGLAEAGYLTNENVFDLTELPRRLLVIGGGPLGCELAQAFCRLGSKTIIVQDKPLFLGKEERDAAQILSDAFARDGIEVRLNTTAVAVRMENGEKLIDLVSDDYRNKVAVDAILTGIGHLPNVRQLGLEVAGVDYDIIHGVHVDDFLRTSNPNIYAAGDVCLEHKYTHTAEAAAHIVVENALFGGRERLSELVIPWCTFTDPEIAHVGLYVREANRLEIPIKTFTIPMHEIDRAATDSQQDGFVKIHVKGRTDKILGATIVARHAGDMINEVTLAMVAGIGLRTLARVIHAYPTQAAAIQKAAQAYYRTRFTPSIQARARRWLAR